MRLQCEVKRDGDLIPTLENELHKELNRRYNDEIDDGNLAVERDAFTQERALAPRHQIL
jgi:hypothetical protein